MERGREESRKFNIKSNAHFSSYLYTRARTVVSRISYYRASLLPALFRHFSRKEDFKKKGKSQKLDARERTASDVTRSRTSEASERGTERARQRERERDSRSRHLEETRHKAPPCLPDAKPMLFFPCPPSRTSTTIRITLLCAWRIPTPSNANPTRVER